MKASADVPGVCSRLLIHTRSAPAARPRRWPTLKDLAHLLQGPVLHGHLPQGRPGLWADGRVALPPTPFTVRIEDLEGREHFRLDGARSLVDPPIPAPIDVVLPPATYHVIVQTGDARRGYTVALAPGATVCLHLPLVVCNANAAIPESLPATRDTTV